MQYVSSITTRYGDVAKVRTDSQALLEIQSRQGSSLLIDIIAEQCGEAAHKFKLDQTDRKNLVDSLVGELREAILERI